MDKFNPSAQKARLILTARDLAKEIHFLYLDYKENADKIRRLEKVLASVRVDINRLQDYAWAQGE